MRTFHMMMNRNITLLLFSGACLINTMSLLGISLEEKKLKLSSKNTEQNSTREEFFLLNSQLLEKKRAIESLQYKLGMLTLDEKSIQNPPYKSLCDELLQLQKETVSLQMQWQEKNSQDDQGEFESVWHLPDTTIGQLVIDYSPGDCVYIMPPEISGMKIHISSHISVPRSSWGQMLDLILASYGIGIKPLSPFAKQLHFLRVNQSGLFCLLENREELAGLQPEQKIAFVVTPPPTDLRRILQFLERFAPQEQLGLQTLASSIVMVGLVKEIQELLKIYDFITTPKHCQDFRIIALEKGDSGEIAGILMALFENNNSHSYDPTNMSQERGGFFSGGESSGFKVIPLKFPSSSLFLIGRPDQLERASTIIKEIESHVGEIQEKSVFWYACKHSEAEELAKVLSQVYSKLLSSSRHSQGKKGKIGQDTKEPFKIEGPDFYRHEPKDSLVVSTSMISPLESSKNKRSGEINEQFIVDTKTNSIIMVVEKYLLDKLKELLAKLDIPKKMVQLDVLLVEKKVSDASSIGLSMLRTDEKSHKNFNDGISWSDIRPSDKSSKHHKKHQKETSEVRGILEFALSHKAHGGLPPYELAYQFLLSQEDVQINANPSVTTVNQTAAKIAVVDQISINNGAIETEGCSSKESYTRAEYGIIIQITPTVHAKTDEENQEIKFITLATDVTFDSTRSDRHDRPDVTRRNIKNEVRVRDGETVILGGLRRKLSSGGKQSIPFLGDLPGLGKLFSNTSLSDASTEMFIFLTPHILPDSQEEWKLARKRELMLRPGDTPEFYSEIEKAKQQKKKNIFESSIKMLFGTPSIAADSK